VLLHPSRSGQLGDTAPEQQGGLVVAGYRHFPAARISPEQQQGGARADSSPAILAQDTELRHGVIERQIQRGPLIEQSETGQMIIGADQQRDMSIGVPAALDPGVGEPSLGIDLTVRAADGREFREIVQVELRQAVEGRPLRDRRPSQASSILTDKISSRKRRADAIRLLRTCAVQSDGELLGSRRRPDETLSIGK
jgi:hypothetical protein